MPRDLTDTERYEFDELNKMFRPGEVSQAKSYFCEVQAKIRAVLARLDALSHQPESAAPAQPEPQVTQPTSAPTAASGALKEKARIEVIVQVDDRIRVYSYSMGRRVASWFPMDEKRFFDKVLPMALLEAGISGLANVRELDAPNIAALKELSELLVRQSVRDTGCRALLQEQRAQSLRQLEAGFAEIDALFASNAEFLNRASAWISEQLAKAESPPTAGPGSDRGTEP